MDTSAYRWMLKTIYQNRWRIASWYDIDDLINDGHLHFLRVQKRYKDAKDAAHIMALFQRTFLNHLHDLSKRRTKQADIPVSELSDLQDQGPTMLDLAGEVSDTELMAFQLRVVQAPDPVRRVLALLATKQGCIRLRALRRHRRGRIENENEWLCRLLGYNPKEINLAKMVRSFLTV